MRNLGAKVTIYDRDTGEIVDEYDEAIFIGKRPNGDRHYVKVFVAFLRDVLENERLGKGAWRLLLYAIDNLDFNKLEVHIVPDRAMRDLDISKDTFYRWLKVLLEDGYLEKLATNVYRVRPYTAIKGQMAKATKSEPDF
jgi:DNA-binding transcriptional ArsR family regulator